MPNATGACVSSARSCQPPCEPTDVRALDAWCLGRGCNHHNVVDVVSLAMVWPWVSIVEGNVDIVRTCQPTNVIAVRNATANGIAAGRRDHRAHGSPNFASVVAYRLATARPGRAACAAFSGSYIGCLLTVGGAYVIDMKSPTGAKQMVNWDVVEANLRATVSFRSRTLEEGFARLQSTTGNRATYTQRYSSMA